MNELSKPQVGTDTECYRDYFLIKSMARADRSNILEFEIYPGKVFNPGKVHRLMHEYTAITFNGRNYDFPMIAFALHLIAQGFEGEEICQMLKQLSDEIIVGGLKSWQAEERYGFVIPKGWDHIDLIEVAPGVAASLKLYGGRMHAPTLQDLPIEPEASISVQDRVLLRTYCTNDLETTLMLADKLDEQVKLREAMSIEYGLDLRSKSDAQIAEAVLKKEVAMMLGVKPWELPRPDTSPGQTFRYKAPDFIQFRSPELQALLQDINSASFITSDKGSPMMPPQLEGRTVTIGASKFKLGIGGLHSTEQSVSHYADEQFALHDDDVASYYPYLILVCRLFPRHLGIHFLKVYRTIVEKRIHAKRNKFDVIANALKIVLNGTFGKLGSPYSVLYSPDLMIQVTVTGQLALLMLIEMFELHGIRVLSANTDGVVTKVSRNRVGNKAALIAAWEGMTGLTTEQTEYLALHSRDVNNYVAVKLDGEAKTKGVFTRSIEIKKGKETLNLMKNPSNAIIPEAVVQYLTKRVPVEDTIRNCTDIRRFVNVRTVKGGGLLREVLSTDHLTDDGALEQTGWIEVREEKNRWAHPRRNDMFTKLMATRIAREELSRGPGHYLGKVVRFYRGAGTVNHIAYKGNGNKVPLSDSAVPLMKLPDQFPTNIDRDWYIAEARDLLKEVGVKLKEEALV